MMHSYLAPEPLISVPPVLLYHQNPSEAALALRIKKSKLQYNLWALVRSSPCPLFLLPASFAFFTSALASHSSQTSHLTHQPEVTLSGAARGHSHSFLHCSVDLSLSFLNSYHRENDHKIESMGWILFKEKPHPILWLVLSMPKGWEECVGLHFTSGEHMCGKHSLMRNC